MKLVLISIVILQVALMACAGQDQAESSAGGLVGARSDEFVGSERSVAGGTLIGMLMDSTAGRNLDEADRLMMEGTTQRTLEAARMDEVVHWRNPDTGNSGTVTPTHTFQRTSGKLCREYYQTVTASRHFYSAFGTACRQPDGSWSIGG